MAKTKTPFLSLGSRGTVGGVLTSQKRGGDTILRKTPIPTDPYSLAQAYQRWDYRDYAYLWTLLSNSEKQIYRTRGSRYHITGFSQWMREQLKTLPDLAGRWHLDEKSGAIAHDSSKQGNNGIIIGASPAKGLIAGAYSFDGLNDNITIPPYPHPLQSKSVICFFNAPAFTGSFRYLWDFGYWTPPYGDIAYLNPNNNNATIYLRNTAAVVVSENSIPFTPDQWNCLGYTWDGTTVIYYIKGVPTGTPDALAGTLGPASYSHYLGAQQAIWQPFLGRIDTTIAYIRALDRTEMTRWSKRRYPL